VRLHAKHARYSEVDEAHLLHFQNHAVTFTPKPVKEEEKLITDSLKHDDTSTTGKNTFKRIPGTIDNPIKCYQKITSTSTWGKAVSILDVSALRAMSWLVKLDSFEAVNRHHKSEGDKALRVVAHVPNTHSTLYVNQITNLGAASDRVFHTWFVWDVRDNGDHVIAFAPVEQCCFTDDVQKTEEAIRDHPKACKAVKASVVGFWTFTPIAANVCHAKLVVQGKMGGSIPKMMMNLRIKSTLGTLQYLQDKFERNGKEVDREMEEAFPLPPRRQQLTSEQNSIFGICHALTDESSDALVALPSPSPFVSMWKLYHPPKRGENSAGRGKAKCIIDCSAHTALAWFFTYCSRERTRMGKENGDLARLCDSESNYHDCTFSTIKRFSFPFNNREFHCRQLCAVDDNAETLIYVSEPMDRGTKIDYGTSFKTVRASTRVYIQFVPISATQCEVVLHQHVNAGGSLPNWLVSAHISKSLRVVDDLRNAFQRDDEIDAAHRSELARAIRDDPQEYSPSEAELYGRFSDYLGTIENAAVVDLKSPDQLVKMGLFVNDANSGGVGKGSVVVDASIEDCAAWELSAMSREQTKLHHERKGLERSLTAANQHNLLYYLVIDLQIPGLSPREWVSQIFWKREGSDKLVVLYGKIDHADFPPLKKYTRAANRSRWEYERMESVGGIPQTKITYLLQNELCGVFPKWAGPKLTVGQLMLLSSMRLRFDKSQEIDSANRVTFIGKIKNHATPYSDEENRMVDDGLLNFEQFKNKSAKVLKMDSPVTEARIVFQKGDKHAWGWSSTIVRATPEEILAFIWDVLSREARAEDDLDRVIDEAPNDHNLFCYIRKKSPNSVIRDRDFLARRIWKANGVDEFVCIDCPQESNERPQGDKGQVRGKFPSAMRITRMNGTETRVTNVIHPDAGGHVPAVIFNRYLSANLAYITEIRNYFQNQRGLQLWDAGDGIAVGEIMVVKSVAEERRKNGETKVGTRMRELFKKDKGLKEIGMKYEFFECMMTRVVQNKLRSAGGVDAKLCNVSVRGGETIGAGLAVSLASALMAEAAVDEWIGKYPALRELDRAEIWFRPMMDTVALRLLGKVSWGLKFRVFSGAGLSFMDLVSDINVIVLYLGDPDTERYGTLLLVMVGTCIMLQMLIVYLQNKARPRKLFVELMFTLTGLKAGIDAFKVASGAKEEVGSLIDPSSELAISKSVELFCEAIPGKTFRGTKFFPDR
jgi:hypothetical protein